MSDALSDAVAALGGIMLEMQRRRLFAQGRFKLNTPAYEAMIAKALTDEQIGTLAANAFAAGATELARIGHPGAAVHSCNPREVACRSCGSPDHEFTDAVCCQDDS